MDFLAEIMEYALRSFTYLHLRYHLGRYKDAVGSDFLSAVIMYI